MKQTKTKIKKYVLTGGPGVGKSTLFELLKDKGIYTIAEAATYVIEQELGKNPDSEIVPWKNKDAFQRKVMEVQQEWESRPAYLNEETVTVIKNGKPTKISLLEREIEIVVQDRGIVDGLAYYLIDGIEAPKEIQEAAENAGYTGVFILDPVPYKRTETRREDPETAKKLHELIRQVYEQLGYKPINIPAVSPEERVNLILSYIKG